MCCGNPGNGFPRKVSRFERATLSVRDAAGVLAHHRVPSVFLSRAFPPTRAGAFFCVGFPAGAGAPFFLQIRSQGRLAWGPPPPPPPTPKTKKKNPRHNFPGG